MKPLYSRPLVSFVLLGIRFRACVLFSFLTLFACSLASAQQNQTAPAEQTTRESAIQTDKKPATSRQKSSKDQQTDASDSSAEAKNAVDSHGSSAASVQAPSEGAPEAAAKDAAQNPVAHVISIPIQNNTYFNVGPYQRGVNATLIEPVIPFRLTENWILITRTITPLIYVPRLVPSEGENFGLGNINPQFYLSPAHPGSIIWGIGPQVWLPTATVKTAGVNKWGGGVAGVVLTKRGHWLLGTLANNVWTGGDSRGHQSMVNPAVFYTVNQMTLNPFIYYNLRRGWYFVSSTIMTADWYAHGDNRWTVPVGGGFGRVFKMGHQLMNARTQFWHDAKAPVGNENWTMQVQLQLMFPHK